MKNKILKLFLGVMIYFSFIGVTSASSVTTFEELKNAFQNGGEIKLENDIEDVETLTVSENSTVTLDLNGHFISAGLKSADRHYYAISNNGTFTLKDSIGTGYISSRGIENLGSGVMIIESGEIRSIDTNGGAAIWNEANLTIQGGRFITTHIGSPSDNVGSGCLNNQGTATIQGGEFIGANRRTYAIISTGEITMNNNVFVSGAHGALAIDDGKAVVNGGSYSSADYYGLYVSNDSGSAQVTVNNGTFDGKTSAVWIGSDVNASVDSKIEINGGLFKKKVTIQNNALEKAIKINGGTFEDELVVGSTSNALKVSGGKFLDIKVKDYLEDGYQVYEEDHAYIIDQDKTLTTLIEKLNLKVGETYENIYEENKYISVSISNDNIIDFKNNKITALAPGKVTLTFTLNKYENKMTKKVEVTIYDIQSADVDTNDIPNAEVSKENQTIILDKLNEILTNTSDDIKGVTKEVVEKVEQAIEEGRTISTQIVIKEEKEKDFIKDKQVASYFDISLIIKKDDEIIGNITELNKSMTITLPLPTSLENPQNGYKRKYRILRIHDGKVEELSSTVNENHTITFESDKYSIFALSYEDVLEQELDDVPTTGYEKSYSLKGFMVFISCVGVSSILYNKKKVRKI